MSNESQEFPEKSHDKISIAFAIAIIVNILGVIVMICLRGCKKIEYSREYILEFRIGNNVTNKTSILYKSSLE